MPSTRGAGIRIVADKGNLNPGHGYEATVVRTDLAKSARGTSCGESSAGPQFIRETIANIDALGLSDADRRLIYEGNARRVLGVTA